VNDAAKLSGIITPLNANLGLLLVYFNQFRFPQPRWRLTRTFFYESAEMGRVFKAQFKTYLTYRRFGKPQAPLCFNQDSSVDE
jgi:hypothetical protein